MLLFLYGGIQLLSGGEESIKMQTYANRRVFVTSMRTFAYIFLIEYLVHKLLTIVTRFFSSFIKIPVLLKISVLKKPITSYLKYLL